MEINKDQIARAFEENPIGFMAAASAVLMGISRIIQATGNARGSAAYARDVNRRVKMAKKQYR